MITADCRLNKATPSKDAKCELIHRICIAVTRPSNVGTLWIASLPNTVDTADILAVVGLGVLAVSFAFLVLVVARDLVERPSTVVGLRFYPQDT